MAQAAVDLPDPLDQTAGSGADTDDLLSQLAGNEIDRLLSEADADHSPKLLKPILDPKMIPSSATPSPKPAPAQADVSKQLHNVLGKIDEGTRPAPPPPMPAPDSSAGQSPPEPERDEIEREAVFEAAGFDAPAKGAANPATDEPAQPSEREALLIAAGFDANAGDEPLEQDEPQREYDSPLPFYLMPLQIMNAPLDAFPQRAREIMGKLAIVTLINAVAAIAFVLFLKKH